MSREENSKQVHVKILILVTNSSMWNQNKQNTDTHS